MTITYDMGHVQVVFQRVLFPSIRVPINILRS
jgi:hypothetical protein